MALISKSEIYEVQKIGRTLKNIESPSCFGLEIVKEEIRKALRSPLVICYTLDAFSNQLSFGRFVGDSEAGSAHVNLTRKLMSEAMVGRIDFAAYNPMRPQVEQRNQVLTLAEMLKLSGGKKPATLSIFPKIQMENFDQLRFLPCEGASMLGFVGTLREEPYTSRDKAVFKAFAPYIRARLQLEREFGKATSADLLAAVLETVGSAAFILSSTGAVVQTNALGVELWGRDSHLHSILKEAVENRRQDEVQITPLRMPGLPSYYLATIKKQGSELAARVEDAGRRWQLTKKQLRVLELVSRGMPNKTIAAQVGVAEVTIESHLTKLFVAAEVENRSSLVARIWSLPPD